MKQKFDITGMSCASCSAHVEKSVSKVASVLVDAIEGVKLIVHPIEEKE